ncbi:MAG: aminoglycoside phosphotransferase family protein [Acidimicrobiia bacterium]|nr:aminoglycoside phosphotransferase family protein [Acidimicrobiia bacterium]
MTPAQAAAAHALLPVRVRRADVVGQGHINTTTRVEGDDGSLWCLQRLNPVFADERVVMANVEMVVAQLRRCGHRSLDLCVADGRPWWSDDDGGVWRAYRWIDGEPASEHARPDWTAVAGMVGSFSAALADLDDHQVVTVVERFHHPVDRWYQLEQAVADDAAGRLARSAPDLDHARRLADRVWAETPATHWAELPQQVVHNDTKTANILVEADGSPITLIDLDTTMMGSPLNDLGEFVRGCPFVEGRQGGERLARLALAFAQGLDRPLAAPEWEGLASAAAVLSFENAVRALTDHLDGDRYYDLGEGVNLGRFQRHATRAEALLDLAPAAAAALAESDGSSAVNR